MADRVSMEIDSAAAVRDDTRREIAALRAEVDALKADCEQMDALTDERDFLRAEVERWHRLFQREKQFSAEAVERSERAEALLKRGGTIPLENPWSVRWVEGYQQWNLRCNGGDKGWHPTLAAALATYEQSRENTE